MIKRYLVLLFLVIGFITFSGCSDTTTAVIEDVVNENINSSVTVGGVAQKGPFLTGSRVVIYKLDSSFERSDESVESSVTDDNGSYTIEVSWSGLSEVEISGYYFDEVIATTSAVEATISSIINIDSTETMNSNINLFTHLASGRVRALLKEGKTIEEANAGALDDLIELFALVDTDGLDLSALDLTHLNGNYASVNAELLRFSAALMDSDDPIGDLEKFVALYNDEGLDGLLKSDEYAKILMARYGLDMDSVLTNMTLEADAIDVASLQIPIAAIIEGVKDLSGVVKQIHLELFNAQFEDSILENFSLISSPENRVDIQSYAVSDDNMSVVFDINYSVCYDDISVHFSIDSSELNVSNTLETNSISLRNITSACVEQVDLNASVITLDDNFLPSVDIDVADGTPSPIVVGTTVVFVAHANDINDDVLEYAWRFGLIGSNSSSSTAYKTGFGEEQTYSLELTEIGTYFVEILVNDPSLVDVIQRIEVNVVALQAKNVVKTGVTISQKTGDDGFYQSGQERSYAYTDNIDSNPTQHDIILDNQTGLQWQDEALITVDDYSSLEGTQNWDKAKQYCENLILHYYEDWRLPSMQELLTLVDYTKSAPAMDDLFKNVGGLSDYPDWYYYWSSTEHARDDAFAWKIDFYTGEHHYTGKDSGLNVKCVRGEALVENQFTRDSVGVVEDLSTHLRWQDNEVVHTYSIDGAISYCEDLTLGDESNWRLPNVNELLSLIDHTQSLNISSIFENTNDYFYYSSTPSQADSEKYWIVGYENDGSEGNRTQSNFKTRCVSGENTSAHPTAVLSVLDETDMDDDLDHVTLGIELIGTTFTDSIVGLVQLNRLYGDSISYGGSTYIDETHISMVVNSEHLVGSTVASFTINNLEIEYATNITTNSLVIGTVGVVEDIIVEVVPLGGSVKKTLQTISYDASGDMVLDDSLKDDGYYKAGTTPSYTRASDIVTDSLTNLMWQDDLSVSTVSKSWFIWDNYLACYNNTSSSDCFNTSGDTAATYCSELTLGSYTDWRLPTVEELSNIVDYSQASISIDKSFLNTSNSSHWTSNTYVNNNKEAWAVVFDGRVLVLDKYQVSARIRCVRDGQ